MIPHNEIQLILSVTSKRNLLTLSPRDLVTNLSNLIIFVIAIYKINLSSNQDIFLIKHRFILEEKNLYSKTLGSGLNPRGVLDFSPLYFFSKRKMTLQGS